jgi:hypothetical protein
MFALSGFVLRVHHFHMSILQLVKKYWHRHFHALAVCVFILYGIFQFAEGL